MRKVALFRNNRNQAIRLPKDFEFTGVTELTIEKRGDTLVRTLREEYGSHVAPGYRSDTKLETVREDTGKSLSQILKK